MRKHNSKLVSNNSGRRDKFLSDGKILRYAYPVNSSMPVSRFPDSPSFSCEKMDKVSLSFYLQKLILPEISAVISGLKIPFYISPASSPFVYGIFHATSNRHLDLLNKTVNGMNFPLFSTPSGI